MPLSGILNILFECPCKPTCTNRGLKTRVRAIMRACMYCVLRPRSSCSRSTSCPVLFENVHEAPAVVMHADCGRRPLHTRETACISQLTHTHTHKHTNWLDVRAGHIGLLQQAIRYLLFSRVPFTTPTPSSQSGYQSVSCRPTRLRK